MGAASPGRITRIGLLLCLDAIPAFNLNRKGAPSLMPTEWVNLSLPAHMRYDPDNMIVWVLIPADMSAEAQRKYFEYLIEVELNARSSGSRWTCADQADRGLVGFKRQRKILQSSK